MVKRTLAAGAVLAGTLCTTPAGALELGTPASTHPYRSPQHFALEIRLSPYRPSIDDEPAIQASGRTPYRDAFGDSRRVLLALELDWQILRIPYVGTIGPGLGAGFVTMSRTARTKNTGEVSGDDYSLTIYPMYLAGVLRADALWRDAGVPLVPYGKLGVGFGIWRASTSGGTSRVDGVVGSGATWGTHAALGVAFALDAIDPGATRNMDNAIGINNTYLYAEYYWLGLNGIAQENALRVGTNSWAAGLAFEF